MSNREAACTLAEAGWPSQLIPLMVAVGHRESGLNAGAVNKTPVDGYHATGWLQVVAYPDRAKQWDLTQPLGNAQAALAVYRSQGLGAWSTYTDGSYRAQLSDVENDLASWTPGQCGSTSASSSPGSVGIAGAASDFGAQLVAGAQVGLGVVVAVVGGLLILSQTQMGGQAARSVAKAAKVALAVVPK
jgi:hypothetical protein